MKKLRKQKREDLQIDLAILALSILLGFFLNLSATAFYDIFTDIAVKHPTVSPWIRYLLFVGPLVVATYVFRSIYKGLYK